MAVASVSGSAVYTPSTRVAFMRMSASISMRFLSGGRIRRDERRAGAAGQDHDAALFQMPLAHGGE